MTKRIDPKQVPGWGIDADPANNPTYPMRDITRDDKGGMNWARPPLQPPGVEVLCSTEHQRRTAVFGTSAPPSGLSGMLRRVAFTRSEGRWSHWLILLFADRINVVEGVLEDLGKGRVPNIPVEMGLKSELRHNPQGFMRKVAVVSGVITLAMLLRARSRAR
ncbi:hypothetical protein ACFQXB_08800 [Plastorhodobacter daqingensis]|uniref:Uncharacterized protein n=1 Tax=Plastorhodobacter daqingensis TaxID=1387281 RepID=A0ABW2UL38_9RHOB